MIVGRVWVIAALAACILGTPLAADAQQPGKVQRIGVLLPHRPGPLEDHFRQRLKELGHLEGQTIVIEYRWSAAGEQVERLRGMAAELVGLKLDALVAISPQSARAAKSATSTIPIVMVAVDDPVGAGLVASLARPGGNATGLAWDVSPELLSGKTLQLLKQALPRSTRVAILWNLDNPSHPRYLKEFQRVAPTLVVTLQPLGVRRPEEFDSTFRQMVKERVDAVIVFGDPLTGPHAKRLAELAAGNRLPSMCGFRGFTVAGCLMSYGPSTVAMWRRAADYVDKILRGARPADLPVEQPTTLELIVNLKTAKILGLRLPQLFLARADEVIE